jgi:N-acetylglucosamine kinase-like BadF-type ATPase
MSYLLGIDQGTTQTTAVVSTTWAACRQPFSPLARRFQPGW